MESLIIRALLFSVFMSQVPHCAWSDYDLYVRWHHYDNTRSQLANGRCCFRWPWSWWCDSCWTSFSYCLRPAGTPKNSSTCSLGRYASSRIFRTDSISGPISDLHFHVEEDWTGTFQLMVDVRDHSRSNRLRMIDNIFFEPAPFQTQDNFTSPLTFFGVHQSTSVFLRLSFNVECSANYYDQNCSTHCVATNAYTCGSHGEPVCRTGYYGPQCAVHCVARDDESAHFTCDGNGTQVCLDGFYGANCTIFCEESERYQCDADSGERVCVEELTGANCSTSVACLSSPCMNGGTCGTSDSVHNISCTCTEGFYGDKCQLEESSPLLATHSADRGALVTVIGVLVFLLVTIAIVAVIVVVIRRSRRRLRAHVNNSDLQVRMLRNEHSHAVGVVNAESDSTVGHEFHNPLYTYSIVSSFSALGDSLTQADSFNDSDLYSTIDHRDQRQAQLLRYRDS